MNRALMHRPSWSGCPAPAHTETGTIQCVVQKGRCTEPEHAKWRWLAWVMPLIWAVKPWWPNAAGKRLDNGELRDPATCSHTIMRSVDQGTGLYECCLCGTKQLRARRRPA